MKVLVVGRSLPTDFSGSLGLFEYEQAKSLNEFNDVGYLFVETSSLLTNRKFKMYEEKTTNLPIVGYYFPAKGLPGNLYQRIRTQLFIKSYKKFVKENGRPDIVHIHYPLLVINEDILHFLQLQNCKIIVTEHWSKVQEKELNKKQLHLLEKVYEASATFICVSNLLRKSVEELLKVDNSSIEVVPNMISNLFFKEDSEQNLSVSTEKFVYTFIGTLNKEKRVDLLIESFIEIFKEHPDTELRIIGDGRERIRLTKLVPDSLKDRILFKGKQPREKVYSLLYDTSVYISASNLETFGVPFVEAMAMGIPVVAADNLGVSDFITEETGLLFSPNIPNDITVKMEEIFHMYRQYDASQIKRLAYQQFSEKHVVEKLQCIYQK